MFAVCCYVNTRPCVIVNVGLELVELVQHVFFKSASFPPKFYYFWLFVPCI